MVRDFWGILGVYSPQNESFSFESFCLFFFFLSSHGLVGKKTTDK